MEWSSNSCDRAMLATLLSTTDYADLVPAKETSIRCLLLWFDALPGLPKNSLSIIFNGIFPDEGKILASRHHALADTIMLCRFMQVFFKEALAHKKAYSIYDHFQKAALA